MMKIIKIIIHNDIAVKRSTIDDNFCVNNKNNNMITIFITTVRWSNEMQAYKYVCHTINDKRSFHFMLWAHVKTFRTNVFMKKRASFYFK
jgi:hypothetical protein